MENNEIMNYEEIEVMDETIMADENTGIGTGVAMLIGAGLTFAVGAAVKLGKKAYETIKAKRELRQPDREIEPDPQAVEELSAK